MNFNGKEFGVRCLTFILTMAALGMGYLNAQTTGGTAQPTAVSTPKPARYHKHKNLMNSYKIPNEGRQPGYSANTEPTVTITQVAP